MKDLKGRIKYLEGLVEGKELTNKSDEGKVIVELLSIISDLTDKVDELQEQVDELQDFKDELDESATDLDDMLGQMFHSLIENGPMVIGGEEVDEDDEDAEDLYEVECSNCGETYFADFEDFMTDDVVCPNCQTPYKLSDATLNKLLNESDDDE